MPGMFGALNSTPGGNTAGMNAAPNRYQNRSPLTPSTGGFAGPRPTPAPSNRMMQPRPMPVRPMGGMGNIPPRTLPSGINPQYQKPMMMPNRPIDVNQAMPMGPEEQNRLRMMAEQQRMQQAGIGGIGGTEYPPTKPMMISPEEAARTGAIYQDPNGSFNSQTPEAIANRQRISDMERRQSMFSAGNQNQLPPDMMY